VKTIEMTMAALILVGFTALLGLIGWIETFGM
jgi:hypothetical protein